MRTIFQDVQFGMRLLLKSPGFTLLAVLTLAIGIAANSTVFSWVDGLLLRPFPGAADSGELAVLEQATKNAPNGGNQVAYLDYLDYRRNLKSLAGIAAHREEVFTLGDTGRATHVWGELVSGDYFSVLGVRPILGRTFTAQEDGNQPGAYPVAVISHRLWKNRYQSDPNVAGRTIRVNHSELTIAGVAPPEFRGTMPGLAFDIWVPLTMGQQLGMFPDDAFTARGPSAWGYYAVVRLAPGVALEQARAEAALYARQLEQAYPESHRGISAAVLPVWQFHSAAPDLLLRPLIILMSIALLFLVIVCANVANLLLARAVSRRKELTIRMALGAGQGRIARQLLTEALLLAVAGAGLGMVFSYWSSDVLAAMVPNVGVSVATGFVLNARMLAFLAAICAASALISGVVPAALLTRTRIGEVLKDAGRSGTQGAASHRMRAVLVFSEVTLATLALIGAGLFARSFANAKTLSPGFDRSNVLLARYYLSGSGFSNDQLYRFSAQLRDRLAAAPGVRGVSYADNAPLGSSAGPYMKVGVDGYQPAPDESMNVNRYLVGPGYFEVLRISLLDGRDFTIADDRAANPVAIVNQSFARKYFNGANPVGRHLRIGAAQQATIIGMVRDSKYFDVSESPRPHLYFAFHQRAGAGGQLYFLTRTSGDPLAFAADFRRETAAVDSAAGAVDLMTLAEWTEVTMLPRKVTAALAAVLAALAMIVAAVGLYSALAYAVSQRTQEIGIRMALGAKPGQVLTDVLRRGVILTVPGLLCGIAASAILARMVAGMLLDVSPGDPLTFAAAALLLVAIALLASYLPARRATRVDPMVALRHE
ncbi:MAG: ABC transporter permease [Acidobacteriota bacterium]